jgi:hypothetical protein
MNCNVERYTRGDGTGSDLHLARRSIESVQGVRQEVVEAIALATKHCLNDTNLSVGTRKKVLPLLNTLPRVALELAAAPPPPCSSMHSPHTQAAGIRGYMIIGLGAWYAQHLADRMLAAGQGS